MNATRERGGRKSFDTWYEVFRDFFQSKKEMRYPRGILKDSAPESSLRWQYWACCFSVGDWRLISPGFHGRDNASLTARTGDRRSPVPNWNTLRSQCQFKGTPSSEIPIHCPNSQRRGYLGINRFSLSPGVSPNRFHKTCRNRFATDSLSDQVVPVLKLIQSFLVNLPTRIRHDPFPAQRLQPRKGPHRN